MAYISNDRRLGALLLVSGMAVVLAVPVSAQVSAMTLEQALDRARNRAAQIVAARDRIEEARSRLAGASLLLRENPAVSGAAGPRSSALRNTTDYDFTISQGFELGSQRSARIEGAQAGIERETASSRNVTRTLLREVGIAFVRSLAAQERMRLTKSADKLADDLRQSVERRYQAGDVPVLEVNLARNSAARAKAESYAAESAHIAALGELRGMLAMSAAEPLAIAGDLRDRRRYDMESLAARSPDRPDLKALAAEIREAESEVRLGKGFAFPNAGVGFTYKRDQGDRVLQGAFTFTLPVFNRGQEIQAEGGARAHRLRQELQALQRAVDVEIRTAFDVYRMQVAAAEELERNALPSLEENDTLSQRSFEEGEIGLAELLLVRRETFETRLVYTERLLEAAVAGIELEARAGVLQ
jgi:cobalt-zinc-cadmium efflux system outer membrane protein